MDWNLRTCGRVGHVTYAPDEPELRERLRVSTPLGEAWRCLRCGDYVVGEPHGRGPADDAPLVRRGKELRDAVILRLLAVERFFRGLLLGAAAYGVWRFRSAQSGLRQVFVRDLPALRQLGIDIDQSKIVHWLREAFAARSSTLTLVTAALGLYAALEITEGVGLWLLQRWGEYFAAAATSIFLPLEIYELTEKITWLRVTAFVINVAAVVYLVYTKRLFGFRGGYKAYEAERHEESLLEVEASAAGKLERTGAAARDATPVAQPGGVQSPGGSSHGPS